MHSTDVTAIKPTSMILEGYTQETPKRQGGVSRAEHFRLTITTFYNGICGGERHAIVVSCVSACFVTLVQHSPLPSLGLGVGIPRSEDSDRL
jgi:hypothetical protein